ncbi:MAG: hypothetical protein IJ506_02200 [Clostridia bacterium]|nr:hypothetical protein [Clostridia bacterium]
MKKEKRLKEGAITPQPDAQDMAAGAFMQNEQSEEILSMKRRIKKAHSKAKCAGILYLIGSIALFAFLFIPFMTVTTGDAKAWEISVASFLKPVFDLGGGLNYNSLVLLPVAVIYTLMLLVGFINLLVSFASLSGLSKKNPTRMKGYNRNALAMKKLGNCFSGTAITILFGCLLIYAVAKAEFSALVYIAVGVAVFFRLVCGLIGAKIARYDIEDSVVEYKRSSKVGVYFLRNLIHILALAGMVFFFAKAVSLNGTMAGIAARGFGWLTDDVKFLIDSCLQVLLLVWLFIFYNHAFHATEYNIDGMKGRGMKNYRVFSVFTAVTAIAWFFVRYVLTDKWTVEIILIAVVSIVVFVLDLFIKTKNNERIRNACEQPKAEETATPQPIQPSYRVPLHCITQPGVFMQPNGQPVMVMPMQYGKPMVYQPPVEEATPVQAIPVQETPTVAPVSAPAPTPTPAPAPAPEQPIAPAWNEWDGLVFEWDPNGKPHETACPYCGKKLKLKSGAPGYRCSACGRVFQLKKVVKVEEPEPSEQSETAE